MPLDPRVEATVADHRRAGADARAAEALIRGYGGELYSYLCSKLVDNADADDAFAMFCEDIWRGLAGYRGEASYRTWSYTIARAAAARLKRSQGRRRRRFDESGNAPEAALAVAAEVRKTTAIFRRTEVKDRFRQLREELPPDDQELLILRVDRELDWKEIAAIWLGSTGLAGVVGVDGVGAVGARGAVSDLEIEREAAALRKRFERVKERLRRRAEKAGLLAPPGAGG